MRALFRLFALFSLGAAAYHAVGLSHPVNDQPLWRHALFIGIDLSCTYGFLKRPRWFVWFFGALAVQQWYGHGRSLLRRFAEGHIPWIDIGVLLFTAIALAALIMEVRRPAR
jgi:hypothetical protein